MTYIIEPHIEAYIDKTIDKAFSKFENTTESVVAKATGQFQTKTDLKVDSIHDKFKKEVEHHTGLLLEKFQSDLKLMGETINGKIHETTREVIVEEVTPTLKLMDTKINIFIEEIQVSKKELKNHTVRITRLEHVAA